MLIKGGNLGFPPFRDPRTAVRLGRRRLDRHGVPHVVGLSLQRAVHANGIVFATSRDGVVWTQPRRVPFGPPQVALDRFVPALAVDPSTSGSRARLAIVAYAATQAHGCRNCELVDALLIESANGGLTWGAPQRLTSESMRLPWIAETGLGRMLADYVSVSFAGGRPVPIFSDRRRARRGRASPGRLRDDPRAVTRRYP